MMMSFGLGHPEELINLKFALIIYNYKSWSIMLKFIKADSGYYEW